MYPDPGLQSIIAANVVAANLAADKPDDFGKGFHISRMASQRWQHDTLTHHQLLCEEFVRHPPDKVVHKRANFDQIMTDGTVEGDPQPSVERSQRRPRAGPCYFNHPTTSLMDARKRPRWNAAPTNHPYGLASLLVQHSASDALNTTGPPPSRGSHLPYLPHRGCLPHPRYQGPRQETLITH